MMKSDKKGYDFDKSTVIFCNAVIKGSKHELMQDLGINLESSKQPHLNNVVQLRQGIILLLLTLHIITYIYYFCLQYILL